MNSRTYRIVNLLIVIALGATISYSVSTGNMVLAVAALILALGISWLLKRFTRDVMVDERIKSVDSRAAAIAFRIYAWLAAVSAVIIMTLKASLPVTLVTAGETLAYSTCVLMLLHYAFYRYFNQKL